MASAPTCPLQLLARKVVVPLSKSKPPIEVEAPAPPHMLETLAACGFAGDPPCAPQTFQREPRRLGATLAPATSAAKRRRLCGAADCERVF